MSDASPFGLLAVDKPAGPTSHDVVEAARRALGLKRVGHTGTLDPAAEGVLLLLVGPAVRCLPHLPDWPKTYEAVARLGVTTDTDDAAGKELLRRPVKNMTESGVREALAALAAKTEQVPPNFAAVKIGGERAYAKARRGETPAVKARPVRIDSLELLEFMGDRIRFRMQCGGGTYVRSVCRDLGEALACGAHCASLTRTAIGPFLKAEALPLAQLTGETGRARIKGLPDVFGPERCLTPPDDALAGIPRGRGWEFAPADAPPQDDGSPPAAGEKGRSRLAVSPAGVPLAIVRRHGRVWQPEVVFPGP